MKKNSPYGEPCGWVEGTGVEAAGPAGSGFYTLTARAYDDGGADTTSVPVTVRVK